MAFKNGFFYTPLSSQSGDQKTGSIIKFAPNVTEVVTGIEEGLLNKIVVYPNPTSNVIRLSHNAKISQAYIIDSLGNKVNARIVEEDSMDVSHLSQGIYYLVAGSKRYRFIKF